MGCDYTRHSHRNCDGVSPRLLVICAARYMFGNVLDVRISFLRKVALALPRVCQ